MKRLAIPVSLVLMMVTVGDLLAEDRISLPEGGANVTFHLSALSQALEIADAQSPDYGSKVDVDKFAASRRDVCWSRMGLAVAQRRTRSY